MNKGSFRVGDKVYVTSDYAPKYDAFLEIAWVSSMNRFKGQIVTIMAVEPDFGSDDDLYLIAEDDGGHIWSPIWLSKVSRMEEFLAKS